MSHHMNPCGSRSQDQRVTVFWRRSTSQFSHVGEKVVFSWDPLGSSTAFTLFVYLKVRGGIPFCGHLFEPHPCIMNKRIFDRTKDQKFMSQLNEEEKATVHAGFEPRLQTPTVPMVFTWRVGGRPRDRHSTEEKHKTEDKTLKSLVPSDAYEVIQAPRICL